MANENAVPDTLLGAIVYFADPDVAHTFVTALRWPNGVRCPHCDSVDTPFIASRRIWQCKSCRKQFSAKVGSIFEDSPLSLSKWLPAVWMMCNCRNGISSYELARDLGVTQTTAWFMLHRIRRALHSQTFEKLDGEVEIDETYIGGKARNMHKGKRNRVIKGTGGMGKVAVMGLLERNSPDKHSTVRMAIVPNVRRRALQANVQEHVAPGAAVYTDALASYIGLNGDYVHQVIDHAEKYVDGAVHTNGLENFWSLLKRSIKGTYVSVEPFHLFRYLDEQAFRFNSRKLSDAKRFIEATASMFGKRLTYNALTGKDLPETC